MEGVRKLIASGDPRGRRFLEWAKRLILDHRGCHKGCDVGNFLHCDLFYDALEVIYEADQAAARRERTLMRCGHPQACKPEGVITCSACMTEARIVAQITAHQRERQER